jgi:hypothetical protein
MAKQPDAYHNDDGEIPPEELELVVEESTGKPLSGTAEDRIKALEQRIAYLQQELRDYIILEEEGQSTEQETDKLIASRGKVLEEAKRQLAAWRAQHQGRN